MILFFLLGGGDSEDRQTSHNVSGSDGLQSQAELLDLVRDAHDAIQLLRAGGGGGMVG